jgi:hypothetical protein
MTSWVIEKSRGRRETRRFLESNENDNTNYQNY